jgi:hypothetical protein
MSAFLKNYQYRYRPPIPIPPPPRHTLYEYIPCTYSHREGGGVWWTSEKVIVTLVQKRGRKYQHVTWLRVSPVYKFYQTPVKATFRVWCLFRYLVHALGNLEEFVLTVPFSVTGCWQQRWWTTQHQLYVHTSSMYQDHQPYVSVLSNTNCLDVPFQRRWIF